MSNSIDIIENSEVNKDIKQPTDVNLLARALQGFNRGVASLPDMASNSGSRLGAFLTGSKEPLWQINPLEHAFEKYNIINPNMPEAQGYGERALEKGAEIAGGMAIPIGGAAKGLSEGAGAVTKFLARALLGKNLPATIGSMVAPAIAAPAIEDYTENPYARGGLEFLSSLGGAGVGAKLGKFLSNTSSLPEYTAAQNAYMENPDASHTKTLIARQLDLAKKDPKSADALDQITKAQESKIIENLTPETPIGGEEIADKIKNHIDNLIRERGDTYKASKASIMENPQAVNADDTLNLIDQLKSEAATGSPLEKALIQAQQLVLDNASDPNKVMKAKTAIQNMAKYSPDLHLDSETDAVMKKIANQFGQDIDKAMPGYNAMNQDYSNQTTALKGIIDGLSGKIVAAGETSPSSVLRKMFEKVDPSLSGQLKEILPSETYGQAADSYIGDVLNRSQTTPSKNVYNDATQTYKIGDILTKNYDTLKSTLPPEQLAKIVQALKDIDTTMIGRPRNDYTIQARRSVAVGDESRGLGTLHSMNPYNPLTWPHILAKKAIVTPLQRNEMLTGVSPMGQIGEGAAKLGIKGEIANSINPLPLTPTQPDIQEQVPSNIAVDQEGQAPTSNSSIDSVMQKYGIGSISTPPSNNSSQTKPQKSSRVLSKNEIDFIGASLKKDPKALLNFDENFNQFSKNGVGKVSFKEAFINNKDLLDQYGIKGERLNHFLAQLAHESGGFNHMEEIDPSKSNLSDKGGKTYKGRGWIQLTGDKNYQKYGDELGLDLVNNPDLAADPDNAFKIAVAYWNDNNLNDLADQDDIMGITRRINGGLNGFEDRKAWLNKIRSTDFEL